MESSINNNPKYFWQYVNATKTNSSIPNYMYFNDKKAFDGTGITNLFAEYFGSAFAPSVDAAVDLPSIDPTSSGLAQIELSVYDVEAGLISLDISKKAGPDNLPPIFFNKCCVSLAFPIQLLFNRSLREGVFPDKWKEAYVVPVLKNESKNSVTNYRPISKLNILSKLFEKLLYSHFYLHLEPLFLLEQYGFLRKRSTETNLLAFVHFLSESFDTQTQVDVIYTDFSKAFDRLNHCILIQKLAHSGIHGSLLR